MGYWKGNDVVKSAVRNSKLIARAKLSKEDYKLIVKTALGSEVTKEQLRHWHDYCEVFESRWGLDKIICEYIALCGGELFEAEFSERGELAYSNSVCLPIRNAFYQMFMMNTRWPRLREMGLPTPLLDYGCGSGFLLHWLAERGYDGLWGFEPPGIQREIMKAAFSGSNVKIWNESAPNKFKTIICLNVLEHVESPMRLLEKFYAMSNRVIADICIDEEEHEQTPHIAPKDELRECEKLLRKNGSLYLWEPHTALKNRINPYHGTACTN